MKIINPFEPENKKIFGVPTSDVELQEIFRAWIAISLAFGILLSRGNFSFDVIIVNVLISAFTVGIGFLFHELAHKVVAQRYGCHAEFRAFNAMLVLAIAFSFLGFVFAAPGAVFISSNVGIKKNGHISAAGPAMNFLFAALFFIGGIFIPHIAFSYGFQINAWLGLFNMIPLAMFDGRKIFLWSKAVWGVMVALGFVLMWLPMIMAKA